MTIENIPNKLERIHFDLLIKCNIICLKYLIADILTFFLKMNVGIRKYIFEFFQYEPLTIIMNIK